MDKDKTAILAGKELQPLLDKRLSNTAALADNAISFVSSLDTSLATSSARMAA